MPTALWIAHVKVLDPDSYAKYAAGATDAIAEHDGVFLARNGAYEQLEGNDRARNVVVRFPSLKRAHECYHSDSYQAALKFAKDAAERDLVIVEEYE